MVRQLTLGDVTVDVVFKAIKNVHLSVYPPTGRVRISAPERMNIETIRAFASTKIAWIRRQQGKQLAQERETPREFIERESHYLWGRRYLLHIVEADQNLGVTADHRNMVLRVKPDWDETRRQQAVEEWYRETLRVEAWECIRRWQPLLGVEVKQLFIQRMRTKWGSAQPANRNIRLNTELARKPKSCVDYIVLHEMAHFLVPNHGPHFVAIMDRHMPGWKAIKDELNAAPLSHLNWTY